MFNFLMVITVYPPKPQDHLQAFPEAKNEENFPPSKRALALRSTNTKIAPCYTTLIIYTLY